MTKTESPKLKTWALLGAGLSILFLFSIWLYSNFASKTSSQDQDSPKSLIKSAGLDLVVYSWSYRSEAKYQASSGSEMSVLCQALGQWEMAENSSLLVIDSFRCNDQELAEDKSYVFDPEAFLLLDLKTISSASPINALAFALSRELSLGKPKAEAGDSSYREARLEASIERQLRATAKGDNIEWTKSYDGPIPSRPEIHHRLEAKTSGSSKQGLNVRLALESLHMKENESIEIGGKRLSESTVGIEMKRSKAPPSLTVQNAEALPLAIQRDPEIERREILSEWRKFLQDPPSSKAASDSIYVRLKLAFRHDPKLISEFRHTLERYSPDSEEFKLLLGALAYAGQDEATNLVVEAAEAKANDIDWQRAIAPVLGLSTKPTERSFDYLDNLRKESSDADLRKVAELAMAGEMKQGLKSDKSEAFQNEVLKRNENSDEIYSMLDVIGNAAIETEIPRLKNWALREDPKLKAAIAESLRLMKSFESEQLLLQLLKDADIEVRRSSVQAFQTRDVSAQALPELLSTLVNSRAEGLQLGLLETIYRAGLLDPDLASKLKDARNRADKDLSSSLRERWIEIEKALTRSY